MMTATTHLKTAEVVNAAKTKSGSWKIKVIGKNTYRYFNDSAIERCEVRRQTESIPWEERKKTKQRRGDHLPILLPYPQQQDMIQRSH